jgi:hypothetical protein
MRDQDLRTLIEAERLQQVAERRPADPMGYKAELSADFVKTLKLPEGTDAPKLDEKNPVLAWWRSTAHEMGLGQDGFQKGVEQFVAWQSGLGQQAQQAEATRVTAEKAKLGEKADERLAAIETWSKAGHTEAEHALVRQIASTALGVQFLEKLMGGTQALPGREAGAQPGAATGGVGELRRMMADPRYADPIKRDPAFVRQVEAGWARLYPGQERAS